ncbi:glycosyltransferase family 2 protein [Limimaricola pyoseonensis]|uniref:Glycosyltransferase involved in cell wall bisynthesis n=1 Tax=Limimaricola pyoseonensis TaxID=521013 RepID=A0A1G7KLH4_9RHOB|nr:glycosyltransferase family 2 protein [Limimaricola pyoseonensis]SDF37780.1 Glycosyltransferase involved in cell wall bisynthesis [Limimaricola pyoseonensis]
MKVSVVIPCFNCADVVQHAVHSAMQNECVQEVICVNDGSTDRTAEVLEGLPFDTRLKVIHTENRGASSARNTGVELTSCPVVALLDADDLFLPGFIDFRIEKLKEKVGENDSFISLSSIANINERFDFSDIFCKGAFSNFGPASIRFLVLAQILNMNTPTMIFDRRTFDRVGGFNEALTTREDHKLLLDMLLWCKIDIENGAGVIRRIQSNSLSRSRSIEQVIADHRSFLSSIPNLKKYERIFADGPIIMYCLRRRGLSEVRRFGVSSILLFPFYVVVAMAFRIVTRKL